MAVILCLETATTNCSVAISDNGTIKSIRELNNRNYSHAEKLHVFIEEVLEESEISKENLDAVAISKGPGSYTGLRIGVSAAKGLAFALDIPLISIPTLQVLAAQAKNQEGFIVPLIDARRMEVYSAVYDSDLKQIRETRAEIVNEHSFQEFLDQKKTIFLGDGAQKFKEICSHPNALFLTDKFPSSREMASLATLKFKKSDIEDIAYFEPYYFKEFKTN